MTVNATSVRALTKALDTSVVRFYFKKKDGSMREALGTRNLDLIPKEENPGHLGDVSNKSTVYWDLEERAYRSVSNSSLVAI